MSDFRNHCNLSDAAFEARRKELRETLLRSVTERRATENGIALGFVDTPGMRERLDAFVDFERECCGGLDFSIRTREGALRLEIGGIDRDEINRFATPADAGAPGHFSDSDRHGISPLPDRASRSARFKR